MHCMYSRANTIASVLLQLAKPSSVWGGEEDKPGGHMAEPGCASAMNSIQLPTNGPHSSPYCRDVLRRSKYLYKALNHVLQNLNRFPSILVRPSALRARRVGQKGKWTRARSKRSNPQPSQPAPGSTLQGHNVGFLFLLIASADSNGEKFRPQITHLCATVNIGKCSPFSS